MSVRKAARDSTASTAEPGASSSATAATGSAMITSSSRRADANSAVSEQLLETVRLTIKDLVRDLLGIQVLPFFFRNFEEKLSADSTTSSILTGSDQLLQSADAVLDATTGTTSRNPPRIGASSSGGGELANSKNNNNNSNSNDNMPKLFAGLRAIALVPPLRRNIDAVCIACVDRLFNLVGPEVAMAQVLHDRIANLTRELAITKHTLQSRQDLAVQQRTELLRELQAAFEQHQGVRQKHDELFDKCKLLAEKQGKSGVSELFRDVAPPLQRGIDSKRHGALRIPVEPVHPTENTPILGAQIQQLSEKLEAQWQLLDEVDRTAREKKELTREHQTKMRQINEKLNRERETTFAARQSEETLKEEVQRLQAKLRQADLMLRAKEHDVELAILRERELSASQGRDTKIQALLARQQENEARMRRMQRSERLMMEIADKESQMYHMVELYSAQSHDAGGAIRRLEGELAVTKAALKEAQAALSTGSGGAGASKAAGKGAMRRPGDRSSSISLPNDRITARVTSSHRLSGGVAEVGAAVMVTQLQEQMTAERRMNERVMADKEKKLRDRDVEVQSLRESVAKANQIQMALQGEIEALTALANRKSHFNSNNNNNNHYHHHDGFGGGGPSSYAESAGGRSVFSDDDLVQQHQQQQQQLIDAHEREKTQLVLDLQAAAATAAAQNVENETLRVQVELLEESFTTKERDMRQTMRLLKHQKDALFEAVGAARGTEILEKVSVALGAAVVDVNSLMAGGDDFLSFGSISTPSIVSSAAGAGGGGAGANASGALPSSAASAGGGTTKTITITKRAASDIAEIDRLTRANELANKKLHILDQQLNEYARKSIAEKTTKATKNFCAMVTPLDILHGYTGMQPGGSGGGGARRSNTLMQRPFIGHQYHKELGLEIPASDERFEHRPLSTSSHPHGQQRDLQHQNRDSVNSSLLPAAARQPSSLLHRPSSVSAVQQQEEDTFSHSHHHHPASSGDGRQHATSSDHHGKSGADGERRSSPTGSAQQQQQQLLPRRPPSSSGGGATTSGGDVKVHRRVLASSQTGSVQLGKDKFLENGTRIFVASDGREVVLGDDDNGDALMVREKKFTDSSGYDENGRRRRAPPMFVPEDERGPSLPAVRILDGTTDQHQPTSASDASAGGGSGNVIVNHRHRSPPLALNRAAQLRKEMAARTRIALSPGRQQQVVVGVRDRAADVVYSVNSDVGNAMDGLVRQAAMQQPPAWIDMTSVVQAAHRHLQHGQHHQNHHHQQQQQQQQQRPSSASGTFPYRHRSQQIYSTFQGRCHDLRLGLEDATTQTDDVIVVQPSPTVSIQDMMRPFSIEAAPPSVAEDQPPPPWTAAASQQPVEYVALLVQCTSGASPFDDVARHHTQKRYVSSASASAAAALAATCAASSSSSAVKTAQPTLQEEQQIQRAALYHTQGPVIGNIQVPPLRFRINAKEGRAGAGAGDARTTQKKRASARTSSNSRDENNQNDDDEPVVVDGTNNNSNNDDGVSDADAPWGSIGKASIVPHSYGTAQLTGGHVAEQLQSLLKKALAQWSNDVIEQAAAAAVAHGGSAGSSRSATPRPRSASGLYAPSRPRTPLHLPVNPVRESIETGAARQPYPRHPLPPETPMRVAPTIIPTPMPHVPDNNAQDRRYVISDRQRAPPSWYNSIADP